MDIEALETQIAVLAKKYDLEFVILFGSQATGRANNKSDIDIAVIGRQEFNMPKLMIEMSELFKRDDVEVVDLRKASPTLSYAVVKEGELLYEKEPDAFLQWKFYAIKIWAETAWLRELRDKKLVEWTRQNA